MRSRPVDQAHVGGGGGHSSFANRFNIESPTNSGSEGGHHARVRQKRSLGSRNSSKIIIEPDIHDKHSLVSQIVVNRSSHSHSRNSLESHRTSLHSVHQSRDNMHSFNSAPCTRENVHSSNSVHRLVHSSNSVQNYRDNLHSANSAQNLRDLVHSSNSGPYLRETVHSSKESVHKKKSVPNSPEPRDSYRVISELIPSTHTTKQIHEARTYRTSCLVLAVASAKPKPFTTGSLKNNVLFLVHSPLRPL